MEAAKEKTNTMRYWEDFTVGQTFALGTFSLSAPEIVDFARKFDPQPYHLSEEEGRDSLFSGLIASGWHVAASFMRLYVETVLKDSAATGSPGVDQLRWLRPVRPDDEFSGRVTVTGRTRSVTHQARGTVKNHCELFSAAGEPVMTMTLHAMFLRYPSHHKKGE